MDDRTEATEPDVEPEVTQLAPEDDPAQYVEHWYQKVGATRADRRPDIAHLADGVVCGTDTGGIPIPLFDVGSRIVVERTINGRWLDTRVYRVKSIDDDTGIVRCWDEECNHHAVVGFKHDGQTFKLAPERGNPFTPPKERQKPTSGDEQPKKRGRRKKKEEGQVT